MLPDAVQQLKTNGQSIAIRIEPEHLGPARLHLTLQNDFLTARVTVDTVQARMVVESALDQLSDQLHRAGIKISSIEVSVSGEGARNQWFQHQADWRRFANRQGSLHDDDLLSTSETELQISTPVGVRTASSGHSINLLA